MFCCEVDPNWAFWEYVSDYAGWEDNNKENNALCVLGDIVFTVVVKVVVSFLFNRKLLILPYISTLIRAQVAKSDFAYPSFIEFYSFVDVWNLFHKKLIKLSVHWSQFNPDQCCSCANQFKICANTLCSPDQAISVVIYLISSRLHVRLKKLLQFFMSIGAEVFVFEFKRNLSSSGNRYY